jgi:hypothetical protein
MNAIINATINKTQLFQPCFLWAEKMYLWSKLEKGNKKRLYASILLWPIDISST